MREGLLKKRTNLERRKKVKKCVNKCECLGDSVTFSPHMIGGINISLFHITIFVCLSTRTCGRLFVSSINYIWVSKFKTEPNLMN